MANEKAFPQTITAEQDRYNNVDSGMDLRDYFAAKAMQGIIAYGDISTFKYTSERAYNLADAMMEARK